MRPKIFLFALAAAVCLCTIPWQGVGIGIYSSCLAMVQLPKLEILSEVKSERKRVSLLDLCNSTNIPETWKSLLAGEDIGEAPGAGSEKVINPEHLRAYIEQFLVSKGYDPSQTEISLPEKIVIKRQSLEVSKEQIESIYTDFILANAPWNPQDVVVRGVYFSGALELPLGSMTFEVQANPRERFLGNVALTIQFFIDGEKERSLRVTGKVDLYQNVVHAVRPLKRNDIIADEDIETQRINIADAPDRFSIEPDQVVGKRLLRDVGFRQPIILSFLDKPPSLKRGSAVTILYQQPGLRLTAKGQTREDGSIGSTVRVVNLMTNRTIFCQVVDETTVQAMP